MKGSERNHLQVINLFVPDPPDLQFVFVFLFFMNSENFALLNQVSCNSTLLAFWCPAAQRINRVGDPGQLWLFFGFFWSVTHHLFSVKCFSFYR